MNDDIIEGSPPRVSRADPMNDSPDIQVQEPSAVPVFIAWEKIRVFFNILFVPGLLVFISGMRDGGLERRSVIELVTVVFLANASFSLGPVFEGYLCLFGAPRLLARGFGLLVAISASLTIVVMWELR